LNVKVEEVGLFRWFFHDPFQSAPIIELLFEVSPSDIASRGRDPDTEDIVYVSMVVKKVLGKYGKNHCIYKMSIG
jgi:hypothetical protein